MSLYTECQLCQHRNVNPHYDRSNVVFPGWMKSRSSLSQRLSRGRRHKKLFLLPLPSRCLRTSRAAQLTVYNNVASDTSVITVTVLPALVHSEGQRTWMPVQIYGPQWHFSGFCFICCYDESCRRLTKGKDMDRLTGALMTSTTLSVHCVCTSCRHSGLRMAASLYTHRSWDLTSPRAFGVSFSLW